MLDTALVTTKLFDTVLVANRGEIAIRILRAAGELGMRTVAIYSDDDAAALHVRRADEAIALGAAGPAAYLEIERVLAIAEQVGAAAIHPGYGFLSENPRFAERCAEQGMVFVGPGAPVLQRLGDKAQARALAQELGVPVLRGTAAGISAAQAADFLRELGEGAAVMLKAAAGGGGRGSRAVLDPSDLTALYERCVSEATSAFGDGRLFAEELMPAARHIEVQIVGDGSGSVSHLWERDCSLQRRHQKVIEIAPAPNLPEPLRAALCADAVRLGEALDYRGLGTIEFLVGARSGRYAFIEANPRLQVEHTVTEEVLGLDLVQAQLLIAGGATLADVGLAQAEVPAPRGTAIQCRVNMETMQPDGSALPGGGVIETFEAPSGAGYRTDSFAYAGYQTSPRFDSLLAKVIVHSLSPSLPDALRKADRALAELRVDGVPTNAGFLRALLADPAVIAGESTTRFIDEHAATLIEAAPKPSRSGGDGDGARAARQGLAGVRVDRGDPLAVLGIAAPDAATPGADWTRAASPRTGPAGTVGVASPMQGTVIQIAVATGDAVAAGQEILVMEAMKMEHPVRAGESGFVRAVGVEVGDAVFEGHPLVYIEPADVAGLVDAVSDEVDLDAIREDIAEVIERHRITLDEARPDAVARRRRTKQRTARENIDDLCAPGSFVEHGALAYAPGSDLPVEEAIRRYPADGLVCGVGNVNADQFGADASRVVVISYDYTVLAGTQGAINHPKTDRMLGLAHQWKLPMVFFTEGGGGRAGVGGRRNGGSDGDGPSESEGGSTPPRSGLSTPTFAAMARLNGVVPTVAINSGYCFAGNAALFGAADLTIATLDSNIGMGGPAMIEGGGLGVFAPNEVGPIDVQLASGVVDIPAADEAEAVAIAKQYLSYFQGPVADWSAGDQRVLRSIVPLNRLRSYEIREVIEGFVDTGSFLELRKHFGFGMVTGLARVEGRPIGVLANNPNHLGGAIDSDGSDKAARFMQLLEAFDIPLVVLCDTPGIMVGPAVEKTGLVRHAARVFIAGANLTIPTFMVVVRKAVGLGAMAMGGGTLKDPFFTVGWPTSEVAGMGLEGQVKLGFRAELEAIADPAARLARYQQLVDRAYESSKGLHHAEGFGLDDVIDPMDTRRWVAGGLASVAGRARQPHPRRVDAW